MNYSTHSFVMKPGNKLKLKVFKKLLLGTYVNYFKEFGNC